MHTLCRLRASLLDCFDRDNYGMLSNCFEGILKKDPTCYHTLARLISMHQNGLYLETCLLMIWIRNHLSSFCLLFDSMYLFAYVIFCIGWSVGKENRIFILCWKTCFSTAPFVC